MESSACPIGEKFIEQTRVQLYGEYTGESCGYCKDGRSTSFGMKSDVMRNEDYEALMYRGFRRCGDFYYKPVMHKTCCPQYTIRLPAASFKPSKSQRSCLRKFAAHLERGHAFGTEEGPDGARRPPNVLTIETRAAQCTDEVFELYRAYQVAVHGDKPEELTKDKFSDFLVASSLPLQPAGSPHSHPLGTHHQLYRIDGKLVAVGVLDFLPSNLSSVYCFYDPSLKHLALGKYSALREIQYCTEIGVPYYCMGFYIHDCPKMNYKGDYSPSELLCPTTLRWFPLSECRALLDAFKFSPLDPALAPARAAVGDGLHFRSPQRLKSDSEGAGEGGKEGEDEDDDNTLSPAERAAKQEHSERMAALFGPRPEESPPNVGKVALTVTGMPNDLFLRQLRETYQTMLKPILSEWVVYAGKVVAGRTKVKIG